MDILSPTIITRLGFDQTTNQTYKLRVMIKIIFAEIIIRKENFKWEIVGIQMLEGKVIENKFFGYSKRLDKNVEIESFLMKPVLKGENINRYSGIKTNLYVFYPHILNDKNKTIPIDEINLKKNFPLGYKYISNFKNELELKKIKYKTNPKFWYSLHRSKRREIYLKRKK
jgi:hypothetical protein